MADKAGNTLVRVERNSCWKTWWTHSSNSGERGEPVEDSALDNETTDVGGSLLGDAKMKMEAKTLHCEDRLISAAKTMHDHAVVVRLRCCTAHAWSGLCNIYLV